MLLFACKIVYLITLYIFASCIDFLALTNKASYPLLMILRYRKSMITTFQTVPYSYKNSKRGRFGAVSQTTHQGWGGTTIRAISIEDLRRVLSSESYILQNWSKRLLGASQDEKQLCLRCRPCPMLPSTSIFNFVNVNKIQF